MRLVLGTELSAKNKIQTVGSLAIPKLKYTFRIINWHQEELQNWIGKWETANHPRKSPKGRCWLLVCSQKMGRKGSDAVRKSLCSRNYKTGGYVDSKEDPLIQTVRTHQHNINLAMLHTARLLKTITERNKTKDSIAMKTKKRWWGKRMHGHCPRNVRRKADG